jgi:Anti-sigma-K factor rskA/Putative zinc-finger
MREPSHQEIQELLGAHALDAVDPETATMIEHHLERCVRCSVEVARHHEVAGLLANSGGASPPELWRGIAARLAESDPPSWERLAERLETGAQRETGERLDAGADRPVGLGANGAGGHRGGRRWVTAGAVVLAAAAAVVAVVLGVRVNHLDHQVNALQASSGLAGAERAALADPATRQLELTGRARNGTTLSVRVVLTASGGGFVRAELPPLPAGRTYQLWGVVAGQTISLGLLGPDPTIVAFSVASDEKVHAFAVTDERSGGVVQTSQAPVVTGAMST